MRLDSRKKSRPDRMMRSKSFDTQEMREIGWKEVGELDGSRRVERLSHLENANNRSCIPD